MMSKVQQITLLRGDRLPLSRVKKTSNIAAARRLPRECGVTVAVGTFRMASLAGMILGERGTPGLRRRDTASLSRYGFGGDVTVTVAGSGGAGHSQEAASVV